MGIKESAKICGQETSTQINGSRWISEPPWCSSFNQRGGVWKEYSLQWALFTVGIVLLVWKSYHLMPSDSLHHSGMSSSTKSTCPTCSQVESHPITTVSPYCQAFTLSIHDQPPSVTFTSNHLPPRHSSICFGHRHLPPHP
jgi:hypothetical protein